MLLVPGLNEDQKNAVIFFLKKLDFEPLLVEGAGGQGTDLSEKYEVYAEAVFAVGLLTGDHMEFPKEKPENPEARSLKDGIFELDFLRDLPGCVLYQEGVDLPSACKGNGLIPYDVEGLWKLLLARRMKMAKLDVDLNKAV